MKNVDHQTPVSTRFPLVASGSAEVAALATVLRRLSIARSIPEVAETVAPAARTMLGAEGVTFVLREGDYCYYAEEDAISPLWKGRRFPLNACISGWCMTERRPAAIRDIYDDPRIPRDAYRPTFVRSLAMVPVRQDDPIAAMGAYWAKVRDITPAELAILQAIANSAALAVSNIELHRAREQLIESEARFRTMADGLPLILWVHDAQGELEFVNQTFCEIFGVDRDEMRGDRWTMLIHPDDAKACEAAFRAAVRARRFYHGELRVKRADGEWRWIESWGRPRFAESGEFLGFVGTSADITERKQVEQHRELLVGELNHRVKNSLAIVQSIADRTFGRRDIGESERAAFNGRLANLAVAHELLMRQDWKSASLEWVVAETLHPECEYPKRVRVEGPPVELKPRQVTVLSMALHELWTNAVKYGALSNDRGRVSVGWEIVNFPIPRLVLTWAEHDGPLVRAPAERGFGSTLIEQALAYELDGTASIEYRPEGVVCVIETVLSGSDERS